MQSARRGFRRAASEFYVAYLRGDFIPRDLGHIRFGNAAALFPFPHREYGLSEAVQAQLRSQGARRKARKTGVVAHPFGICFMDCAQLRIRHTVLYAYYRRRNFNSYQPFLFGVRYDMYSVFLPLPDVDDEKQMLRFLPHLQLGLRNDVHTRGVYKKRFLHFDIFAGGCASGGMGDFIPQIPAALLPKHQRVAVLRELQGKAVQAQKAASELYQKNQYYRQAQKRKLIRGAIT